MERAFAKTAELILVISPKSHKQCLLVPNTLVEIRFSQRSSNGLAVNGASFSAEKAPKIRNGLVHRKIIGSAILRKVFKLFRKFFLHLIEHDKLSHMN